MLVLAESSSEAVNLGTKAQAHDTLVPTSWRGDGSCFRFEHSIFRISLRQVHRAYFPSAPRCVVEHTEDRYSIYYHIYLSAVAFSALQLMYKYLVVFTHPFRHPFVSGISKIPITPFELKVYGFKFSADFLDTFPANLGSTFKHRVHSV